MRTSIGLSFPIGGEVIEERAGAEIRSGLALFRRASRWCVMSDGKSRVWPGGKPKVGARAQRSRAVSARDIELFTEISGDRNPLHYDEDAARRSKFGGIIVQGGVTSAILNAVVAEDLPGPGTVFLQVSWNFQAPVRPGDAITGAVEVVEVREDKPITKLKTTVTRDDGVVVLDGEALCYTMPLGPLALDGEPTDG